MKHVKGDLVNPYTTDRVAEAIESTHLEGNAVNDSDPTVKALVSDETNNNNRTAAKVKGKAKASPTPSPAPATTVANEATPAPSVKDTNADSSGDSSQRSTSDADADDAASDSPTSAASGAPAGKLKKVKSNKTKNKAKAKAEAAAERKRERELAKVAAVKAKAAKEKAGKQAEEPDCSDTESEGDAGAAPVDRKHAGSIHKGDTIVIKGHPCKVLSVTHSKTGKHGSAKAHFTAAHMFTGKKYEHIYSTSESVEVPILTRHQGVATSYTRVSAPPSAYYESNIAEDDDKTRFEVALADVDTGLPLGTLPTMDGSGKNADGLIEIDGGDLMVKIKAAVDSDSADADAGSKAKAIVSVVAAMGFVKIAAVNVIGG